MSSFYLASSYSRRDELNTYRAKLEELGYTVNARWLSGAHEVRDNYEQRLENQIFAQEDMEDLSKSDIFMLFTNPLGHAGRGGHHVETGMAIAFGKEVIIIGQKINVFHYLPGIEFYETFEDFLNNA